MNGDNSILLFVYGTLKPGLPNERSLPADVECLGECITTRKYPLVVEPRTKIPFLLFADDEAEYVKGVLYKVSESALLTLDTFEGVHSGFYERRLLEVKGIYGNVSAYAYFRSPESGGPVWAQPWTIWKLRTLPCIEDYTHAYAKGFLERNAR